MDSLTIYFNAIWQDAIRPRYRVERPSPAEDLASFARRLRMAPQLVYSTAARKWLVGKHES